MCSSPPLAQPSFDSELWASRIAGEADLPDERLNSRFARILNAAAAKPGDSIPHMQGDCGQAKATYRFFANNRIKPDDLLQPMTDATVNFLTGLPMVLAVQDTTSLNFTSLQSTTGLGPLNDSPRARGLHLHTNLAVRIDGVTLGLLGQDYWSRAVGEKVAPLRRERPIEEKESCKWLDGIEAAEAAWDSTAHPRPLLAHVMDREGDIHEVLQRVSDSPHSAIIRSTQNRRVAGDHDKAFNAVAAAPIIATIVIDVPRPSHQPVPAVPQRQAKLELRAVPLTITPSPTKHPNRQPVTWTLVEAREIETPAGVEPLHWRLWTNLPAQTCEEIQEILRLYGYRWRIEDFHLALKSGCKVEKLELETADRLIKAAIVYSAVAARIVTLRDMARVTPDASCTVVLTTDEWQALWIHVARRKPTATTPPPSLKEAAMWIGRMGGHLGRKRDGMPGVRTLWRGFRDLTLLAAGFRVGRLTV